MNKIVIGISGQTCSGKNTILNKLLATNQFTKLVTSTTRKPRVGEIEGEDYYFITHEEAEMLLDSDGFFESMTWSKFGDIPSRPFDPHSVNVYGLTNREIEEKLDSQKVPCVILTPGGQPIYEKLLAKKNIKLFKVFVSCSQELLLDRLVSRTTAEILDEYSTTSKINSKFIREKLESVVQRTRSITTFEADWEANVNWDHIIYSNFPPEFAYAQFVKAIQQFSS